MGADQGSGIWKSRRGKGRVMPKARQLDDKAWAEVKAVLAKLDHLVLQDIFLTETANHADVILPASALAEQSGTVTNTNRQVQIARPARRPTGKAREDWKITIDLANRLDLDWRGSISSMARADRAVAPDMVFLPFALVEAAANILTNPALGPYGKIQEFKFSAVRAEADHATSVAAE